MKASFCRDFGNFKRWALLAKGFASTHQTPSWGYFTSSRTLEAVVAWHMAGEGVILRVESGVLDSAQVCLPPSVDWLELGNLWGLGIGGDDGGEV